MEAAASKRVIDKKRQGSKINGRLTQGHKLSEQEGQADQARFFQKD